MSDRDPVQYVLVRKDLPPDLQMVMVGHATAEAVRVAPIDRRTVLRLLHVADEAELVLYQGKLAAKGVHHALVIETDGPFAGQSVSLGTEPSSERVSALSKLFWHLKRATIEAPPRVAAREVQVPPHPAIEGGFDGDCG